MPWSSLCWYWVITDHVALLTILVFAVSLINGRIQRSVLYLHWVNWPPWADLENPNSLGFAENRVYPFRLYFEEATTFSWHILPLNEYQANQDELLSLDPANYDGHVHFKSLRSNPRARLVIYLHGTAGNLATEHRLTSMRLFTSIPDTHLIAVDYRGFGLSEGTPTQEGLIEDVVALVDKAIQAGVDPSRIILFGQSLGSAVAIAAAEILQSRQDAVHVGKVISVAGFTSIRSVSEKYRIAGIVPILGPLAQYPIVQRWLLRFLYHPWDSKASLANIMRSTRTAVTFVHSRLDYEIPCPHSMELFYTALGACKGVNESQVDEIRALRSHRIISNTSDVFTSLHSECAVKYMEIRWGGHNQIQHSDAVLSEIAAF